jgi:1,5-anhydro-D-fructose reductase (1,5-anhydro-D-mannitol-forming)
VRRIGVAGVWHVHAQDYVSELLGREDVELSGVWDRDSTAASAFAEPRSLATVPRLDSLLDDATVDALVVTTATADHVEVIGQALRAGKHVFSEKVLAVDPRDAQALEDLAERCGRVLMVSFQRLAEPWVPTLLQVVQSGMLGRVTSSRIRYQHAGAVDGWLPEGFLSRAEAGGGAVIDLGVHGFYLSQLFHGSFPSTVTCRTSRFTGREVEDNAIVVLEYPDRSASVLETSLAAGPDDARWAEIHGTNGTALIDPRDAAITVRTTDGATWEQTPFLPPWPTPLDQFLSAIDDDRPAAGDRTVGSNRTESIRLVSLIRAAYRSAELGAAVEVEDPTA